MAASPYFGKIFSQDHGLLRRLYERRKALHPTEGNRTGATLGLMILFATVLAAILFSLLWMQRNEYQYLNSLSGVHIFQPGALVWQVQGAQGEDQGVIDDLKNLDAAIGNRTQGSVELFTRLPRSAVAPFTSEETAVVFALPTFNFKIATVAVGNEFEKQIFSGEPVIVSFLAFEYPDQDIPIRLKFTRDPTVERVFTDVSANNVVFLAQVNKYQKFVDTLAVRRLGSGKQLADIGRIVLAVFCVLLFIFVDSSPECLGLAIFMSLKALGVALAQNWLPDGVISSSQTSFIKHFLLCFADIMQLYFFVQLARIYKPTLKPWFVYGVPLALVYAWICNHTYMAWDINWSRETWRIRNLIVGFGCQTAAWSVAVYCWRDRLYNRASALLIASIGVASQVFFPLIVDLPGVAGMNWYQTFYALVETITPYVFALSTFVNITTLERRVKSLSQELIKAEAMEREMELGQAVQQSFFRVPELPKGLHVTYHHEAAVFVSGDVFYVHWDPQAQIMSMILSDVTGHGVQAALKASVCHAISEAVFWEARQAPNSEPGTALARYKERVQNYLTKISGQDELLSIVGCEYSFTRKVLTLYRSNGVFPIVIDYQEGSGWKVNVVPLVNDELTHIDFNQKGFVLFISDGFLEGCRSVKEFCRHVEEKLKHSERVDSGSMREVVLRFPGFSKVLDDRTFLLFETHGERTLKDRLAG